MAGKRVLILANGHWPKAGPSKKVVQDADLTIAADGGWAKAKKHRIPVDLVVGDLDSLRAEESTALRASKVQTLVYPREKDKTDLEIALDYAVSLEPRKVVVFGALGDRLDHTLANILLLEKVASAGVAVEIENGKEHVFIVTNQISLENPKQGDLVSLLPISETVEGIRTTGLRFPLNRESLARPSSRGVSNEVLSAPVEIRIEKGCLLAIHRAGRSLCTRFDPEANSERCSD